MRLFSFPTSSASFRVRIALNLKGVAHETVSVNIAKGEQTGEAYRRINPHGRVPALELDDGTIIGQSMAIIDYLENVYPEPRLFPAESVARARALAVAMTIAADIHPLNNLVVQAYVRDRWGRSPAEWQDWYAYWLRSGLAAVEDMIDGDRYCFGDRPTVADICLIPQVFNARRFNVDISDLRKIVAIDAFAGAVPAFVAARPDRQPPPA